MERVERYLVLYGYSGTRFHGSQYNGAADEKRCPTVEGSLVSAAEAVARGQPGCCTVSVEVHSRASRTDRGVHALANAVYLRLAVAFKHGARCVQQPPRLLCLAHRRRQSVAPLACTSQSIT